LTLFICQDVDNKVGPQVVEVVGIKSLSEDPFDRLQELHAEVLTTKEGHKALRRLMDKQNQELATLKQEAKEADAARKSQSDEIECLRKQTEADNVRLEELLKLHRMSRRGQTVH
jgi:t-SNARE complex subunit (syntaxin)